MEFRKGCLQRPGVFLALCDKFQPDTKGMEWLSQHTLALWPVFLKTGGRRTIHSALRG